MSRWAWHRFRLGLAWAVVAGTLALALAASGAEQAAEYEYDELGRLNRVVAPEREISYTLDPAGNRNAVNTPAGRGWPSSFTVPANSPTGDYTVSWGASTGTGNRYELYEATDPDFAVETQVYNNTGLNTSFTAKPDNTYYYRIRACDVTSCGPRRTGANPTLVQRPLVPGVPGGMTIPSGDIDGTYTVSWGASSGAVTAYELYEAPNSAFTGQSLVYSSATASADLSGRGNGTYYYRVRACNSGGCSGYRTGGNSVTVTLPPGTPSSISVPSSNTTGSYSISWGSATGNVTAYHLYEATSASFSAETLVYSDTGTSTNLSGRGNGTYYYRVRACNGGACSGYSTGGNFVAVTLPPGTPSSISVPSSNITGSYSISWSSATGNVTAYELYEATNSGFTGQSLVYSGTTASAGISGRGNGNYYYRVRACNTSVACSTYRTGGNHVWVTLPPGVPGAAVAPFTYTNIGNYTLTWAASSGVVTAYELLESVVFGSESLIYSGTNTSFAISGRTHGTRSYRLRACNGPACSGYTATEGNGTVVMVDTSPPTPPSSLSKTGDNVLFWSGGSTDGGTAVSGVDRWRVYRSGTVAGTVLAPLQSFDDTGAPSNQTYTYTVRSVDRAGNESADSPGLTFYVDNIPPAAPTNVSAVATSPQSITVSWTAAVDPLGGTISSYSAYRDGAGPIFVAGSATSFTDTPLSPSTTYTYTIKAWDLGSNESPLSAPTSATTPALPPAIPAIPLNLRFVRPAGTKPNYHVYDVLWDASPPPPTVSYYVLEETLGGATWTYTVNAPTTLRGFHQTVGGTYSYRVRSCTAANVCSDYSPSISKGVCVGAGCNN